MGDVTRELSTWWKALSASTDSLYWHVKRTIGGATGQLVYAKALAAQHVAHAVSGTGEALYAPVQGGGARRDDEQAARKDEARARQAAREESWTPKELDEQVRVWVQSQRRRGQ